MRFALAHSLREFATQCALKYLLEQKMDLKDILNPPQPIHFDLQIDDEGEPFLKGRDDDDGDVPIIAKIDRTIFDGTPSFADRVLKAKKAIVGLTEMANVMYRRGEFLEVGRANTMIRVINLGTIYLAP
jgi:hypothetical protein